MSAAVVARWALVVAAVGAAACGGKGLAPGARADGGNDVALDGEVRRADAAGCEAPNEVGMCPGDCFGDDRSLCGGSACVNLLRDPKNCGACGFDCEALPVGGTKGWSCELGRCVDLDCFPGFADCTTEPGCESLLTSADNCGACGTKACAVANTIPTCGGGSACASPVCAPGFANCAVDNPDCETTIGAASSCFPRYLGTFKSSTRSVYVVTAVGPDGSIFYGGDLDAKNDFDPTAGLDVREPGPSGMAYLTKVNPNGTYAWTRTFPASFLLFDGLAVDADSVVAVGQYDGAVDFDPGPGTSLLTATGVFPSNTFVVKLTQAGTFVWAQRFSGEEIGQLAMTGVALSDGAVYVSGLASGRTDFDPGPGQVVLPTDGATAGFVIKLDASGQLAWARGHHGRRCSGWTGPITAAPGGRVWVTGSHQGSCTFGEGNAPFNDSEHAVYVAALSANGDLFGEWQLSAAATEARTIAASPDGSIYVGGWLTSQWGGEVDLNPEEGTDRRSLTPTTTGFVTKLTGYGAYVWTQLMGFTWVTVAALPDGGVLTSGTVDGRFVTKLRADGTSAWSLGYFQDGDDFDLVAGKTGFIVAGTTDDGDAVDFDPGPKNEPGPPGQTAFFARYSY